MLRQARLDRLVQEEGPWDLLVIGGGASGLGVAVDAATRGLRVALLEAHDMGKGTSSRSTKLVHGGVRYLAQGRVGLVREALRERGLLLRNAPHICKVQPFVIPCRSWWERPWYRLGLGLYDLLAGRLSCGPTRWLDRAATLRRLPGIVPHGLRGGILYYDGGFDDARLAVALARTAQDHGACVVDHLRVTGLLKGTEGRIEGVEACDTLDGTLHRVRAKVVVNCTGVHTGTLLAMDGGDARGHVVPSQGIHLVLDRSFMPGDAALMLPRTPDGRVLFAIPWHGVLVVGTTDVPVDSICDEPRATEAEIDFVLDTVGRYLMRTPTRADVRSVYAGMRPLVMHRHGMRTAEISRGHRVLFSPSGLVSLIGGKWTTYRAMAKDVLDQVLAHTALEAGPCITDRLPIHGHPGDAVPMSGHWARYGSDAAVVFALAASDPVLAGRLHPAHPYILAEVVFAVRHDMACTVEDVLARRVRLLFLDAAAAVEAAPEVARTMARELGRDQVWEASEVRAFISLAAGYRCHVTAPNAD